MGFTAKDAGEAGAAMFVEEMAEKGITLDFSEESVRRLDAVIDDFWPKGTDEDTLSVIVPTMAGYIGEVMIRNIGGKWVDDKKYHQPAIENHGARVYPISEVGDRFRYGIDQSLGAFYAATKEAWEKHRGARRSPWRIFGR
jgi:hypothetical protein